MANSPKITVSVANSMLNATYASGALNGGSIQIYSGTQPTNCGDAITTQTLLATLPLAATAAFNGASGGAVSAGTIGPAQAGATGTATWFRIVNASGTAYLDGSVGTSGCDLNLTSVTFAQGDTVAVTAATISIPLS